MVVAGKDAGLALLFVTRGLGHEKNSQHAFIKRVILRESFLSAT